MRSLRSPLDQRVVIVDDHRLFAEAIGLALTVEGHDVRRVDLAREPSTPGALVHAVLRLEPRVVLLDLDLARWGSGLRLIAPLVRSGTDVVVLTGCTERAQWGDAVRLGAQKVLSKTRPLDEVLTTVRRTIAGLPVMDRRERDDLVREWNQQRFQRRCVHERLDQLTVREREVLGQLMKGCAVREIARLSVVSEATVRTQVKSILAKLEVSSQLAAVGMAHEIGWRAPA